VSSPGGGRIESDPITPELVLKWLREVWPEATSHPDPQACMSVAMVLIWIRDYREIRKSPPPLEAPKHMRLFVRHVPRLLAHLVGRADASRLREALNKGRLGCTWVAS